MHPFQPAEHLIPNEVPYVALFFHANYLAIKSINLGSLRSV